MPYEINYTKTQKYTFNGINKLSTSFTRNNYTATGNERRLVDESIPAGAVNSGLVFNFNAASGAFLSFNSSGPLIVSGAGWNYKITLTGGSNVGVNNYNSWFARTGVGQWTTTDGGSVSASNINGILYVSNPGASAVKLNIESYADINNNWGSPTP